MRVASAGGAAEAPTIPSQRTPAHSLCTSLRKLIGNVWVSAPHGPYPYPVGLACRVRRCAARAMATLASSDAIATAAMTGW
jgi:hypothetical protein